MTRPRTYPRAKVMELCRELGHEPDRVSLIVIEPGWIKVEYIHPVTGEGPSNEAIPVLDEP